MASNNAQTTIPLGVRLCLFYNRLFRWRFREMAEAHKNLKVNPDQFRKNYFDFEYNKTSQLVNRFPGLSVEGKAILDFGCLNGGSTLWYATHGAKQVVGVDVDAEAIAQAPRLVAERGDVPHSPIEFRLATDVRIPMDDRAVDLIITEDVVEHLMDPQATFREWERVLVPGGQVAISFGPLWYHPHGVHLWEVFPGPWNHVLFSERTVTLALCLLKNRPVKPARYAELGMNGMTLRRFERLLKESSFRCVTLRRHALWKMQPLLRIPFVREFFASQVECVLQKTDPQSA
jgi:SAM-dependent methyltransferase